MDEREKWQWQEPGSEYMHKPMKDIIYKNNTL